MDYKIKNVKIKKEAQWFEKTRIKKYINDPSMQNALSKIVNNLNQLQSNTSYLSPLIKKDNIDFIRSNVVKINEQMKILNGFFPGFIPNTKKWFGRSTITNKTNLNTIIKNSQSLISNLNNSNNDLLKTIKDLGYENAQEETLMENTLTKNIHDPINTIIKNYESIFENLMTNNENIPKDNEVAINYNGTMLSQYLQFFYEKANQKQESLEAKSYAQQLSKYIKPDARVNVPLNLNPTATTDEIIKQISSKIKETADRLLNIVSENLDFKQLLNNIITFFDPFTNTTLTHNIDYTNLFTNVKKFLEENTKNIVAKNKNKLIKKSQTVVNIDESNIDAAYEAVIKNRTLSVSDSTELKKLYFNYKNNTKNEKVIDMAFTPAQFLEMNAKREELKSKFDVLKYKNTASDTEVEMYPEIKDYFKDLIDKYFAGLGLNFVVKEKGPEEKAFASTINKLMHIIKYSSFAEISVPTLSTVEKPSNIIEYMENFNKELLNKISFVGPKNLNAIQEHFDSLFDRNKIITDINEIMSRIPKTPTAPAPNANAATTPADNVANNLINQVNKLSAEDKKKVIDGITPNPAQTPSTETSSAPQKNNAAKKKS